jgi:hypothetical protein
MFGCRSICSAMRISDFENLLRRILTNLFHDVCLFCEKCLTEVEVVGLKDRSIQVLQLDENLHLWNISILIEVYLIFLLVLYFQIEVLSRKTLNQWYRPDGPQHYSIMINHAYHFSGFFFTHSDSKFITLLRLFCTVSYLRSLYTLWNDFSSSK